VGADRPDDGEMPPDEHPDRPPDQSNNDSRSAGSGDAEVEPRSRQEYYADLRGAVSAEESAAARRTSAEEQAAAEKWDEKAADSRWMWGEYQRKWPPEERPPVDRSDDPPGSWHGDRNRLLGSDDNGRVEIECGRIVEREQEKISPALRAIESQDPDRNLIGFEHRLKGSDRIKEKVYDKMEELDRSPEQAVALVPDAIRYTFEYRESRYTQGVWSDIGRLKEQGFELKIMRNSWSNDQYKGINSQWSEPETGQLFEVQFHTRISFEAKQLTHGAYERIRTHQADKFELMVLEAFQQKVTAEVPTPPGATDIPDYLKGGADAR
jgi:hypothetical protein